MCNVFVITFILQDIGFFIYFFFNDASSNKLKLKILIV